MLAHIVIRGHSFTASGDAGDVSVYDHRGQKLAGGLLNMKAAEAWCARRAGQRPDHERPARAGPQIGRSRITGY